MPPRDDDDNFDNQFCYVSHRSPFSNDLFNRINYDFRDPNYSVDIHAISCKKAEAIAVRISSNQLVEDSSLMASTV